MSGLYLAISNATAESVADQLSEQSELVGNKSQLPANACVCELPSENFTDEYDTFNLILIVIILPAVAVFGVVTNALVMFVYTRSHMLTSTMNVYLAALAASDVCVDLFGIFAISIDSARRFDPILNEIHLTVIRYTLPLCYIAQMCSVYFTVLAAFDCYLSVCRQREQRCQCDQQVVFGKQQARRTSTNRRWRLPLHRRLRSTLRRRPQLAAVVHSVLVVLACFMYNSVTFCELRVVECVDYSLGDVNALKREICGTELRKDDTYNQLYKVYMYGFFMTFLPFGVLLTLNCMIIITIYRLSSAKKALTLANGSSDGSSDSASESTFMLVMVVALFLLCNSIALAVNVIETFGDYPIENKQAANRLFFIIDIGNFLVVFNSSANFLIYYAFSKAFRAVLAKKRRQIVKRFTSFSSVSAQFFASSINDLHKPEAANNSASQTIAAARALLRRQRSRSRERTKSPSPCSGIFLNLDYLPRGAGEKLDANADRVECVFEFVSSNAQGVHDTTRN